MFQTVNRYVDVSETVFLSGDSNFSDRNNVMKMDLKQFIIYSPN